MNSIHINNKAIFILLCFALLLRIGALFLVDKISNPQVWESEEIANNLLTGKGFYYTEFNTKYRNTSLVLYPLICAGIYYFTKHSFLAVKIFQILTSVLASFVVYMLATRLFDNKRVGLFALGLIAFHPGLVVYSIKLHSLSFDILLFLLSIYFFLSILEGIKILKNSLLAGIFIGMALLTRAVISLFIPIAWLIITLKMKNSYGKIIRSVSGITMGIFLILLPLIIRNYLLFGQVVILPNDSGFNFWTGNNPYTLGTANTMDNKSIICVAPKDLLQKLKGLDEFQQNKLFYEEAWSFIKNNPQRFFILFAKKLYYFWWFSPAQGLNYPTPYLLIYKLYYSVILFFAILSFFTEIRIIPGQKKQMAYILILFLAIITIAQALYYVDGRHRWTVEPFILIFSASGINFIWTKLSKSYKIDEETK